MNKNFIVSILAIMTAISGVTYYTFLDNTSAMRAGQDPLNTADVYQQWLNWLSIYGVTYQNEEIPLKFATFSTNYNYIQAKNAELTNYQLGLNQFADLTNDEFAALNQGSLIFNNRPRNEQTLVGTLPASINWNSKGAVTPIKNQGQCGSCWAFSTTGSLEGLNFIKNGQLLSFSEQQLVDCSSSYGNQGCNGGLMDDAFQYVEKYGIELESTYAYTGQSGTCQYNAADAVFKNTGYVDVVQNNSMQLKTAVAQGPVSIAIEADSMNFQFYTSGVFDDASCGTNLDHGVLNVGYGTSSGQDYWIVKNSWGATWGNNGFIWIAFTSNTAATPGICGINMSASYPTA